MSLFLLVLLLQNPVTLFAGNVHEFALNPTDYFPRLFAAYVVILVVVCVPIFLFRGILLAMVAVPVLFAALLLWTYSNILVIDFGKLDGGQFEFGVVEQYRYWELGASVLVFGGLLYLYVKYSLPLAYFMVVLNVLVGSTIILQMVTSHQSGREFSEAGARSIYRLSETKNLLIVVMDQFQSDIFADLVNEDPDIRRQLQGFTFFPDTLGVAPTTRLTMPSIHAGEVYVAGPKLSEFYQKHVVDGSFLNKLSEAGHEVSLVSPPKLGCPKGASFCRGVWPAMFTYEYLRNRETERLLNYSLFRAVPLALKPHVYNGGSWLIPVSTLQASHFVVIGNLFLQRFSTSAQVSGQRPATKFIHLMNTHRPYVLNEACEYTGDNHAHDRRAAMLTQARCALAAFGGVLRRLKDVGAYDRTAIVLVADTGVGAFNIGSSHGLPAGEVGYIGSGLFGAANPVLAVKPMRADSPFATSRKRVQLTDVAATVCDIVGDCDGFPGESVFEPGDGQLDRVYNFYYLTQDWDKKGFVPEPTPYRVDGPLWELGSWPESIQPRLRPNKTIELTHAGHNAVYLGEGWGPITALGTNTYEEEAVLYVVPEPQEMDDSYELVVIAEAMFPEQNAKDELLDVLVNGQKVGSWTFLETRQAEEKRAKISRDILRRSRILNITFKLNSPDAWVVERGNVRHIRVQGIRLHSVQFNRI